MPAGAAGLSDFDRFQFENDCQPVAIVVAAPAESTAAAGLSASAIEDIAREALEGSGVTVDSLAIDRLWIFARIQPRSTAVTIAFYKRVIDEATGIAALAATWIEAASFPRAGPEQAPARVLASTLRLFAARYRLVNREACR